MKQIDMDEISAGALRIEGGWQAWVPEVTADADALRVYGAYLRSSRGDGRELAAEKFQQCFESGYLDGLKDALRRYAAEYAKRWPSLVNWDGTLKGFKPWELQRYYVPFEHVGRRGKISARKIMTDMAAEALRKPEHETMSGGWLT